MARRGVSFDVLGLSTLTVDLNTLRDETRAGLERVVEGSAKSIRDRAQYKAPRDRGDLADAIEAQGRGLNWRVGIVDARIPSRGGQNSAHLNPWVYGVWYELGFKTRKIDARPYMGPSVDEVEPIHSRKVDDVIDGALR